VSDVDIRRARSFGAVADAYRRARPSYPAAAVAWLLDPAPGRRVVDLAAGTGKLTEVLVRAGAHVVAVEPLAEMRAALAETVPGVTVHAGTAEDIPLPAASADAVLVAQAFHWFDEERALPEIARVLAPGGVLGLLWNLRDDRIGWVRELTDAMGGAGDVLSASHDEADEALGRPPFGRLARRRFPNPEPFDRDRLREWARSTSSIATLAPAQREDVLAAIGRFAGRHPDLGGGDGFTMPFVTVAVRAQRT
jgi:SAM-dependent methyltransferase